MQCVLQALTSDMGARQVVNDDGNTDHKDTNDKMIRAPGAKIKDPKSGVFCSTLRPLLVILVFIACTTTVHSDKDISRINHGVYFKYLKNIQPVNGKWYHSFVFEIPEIEMTENVHSVMLKQDNATEVRKDHPGNMTRTIRECFELLAADERPSREKRQTSTAAKTTRPILMNIRGITPLPSWLTGHLEEIDDADRQERRAYHTRRENMITAALARSGEEDPEVDPVYLEWYNETIPVLDQAKDRRKQRYQENRRGLVANLKRQREEQNYTTRAPPEIVVRIN
jgi:hypothetical protein